MAYETDTFGLAHTFKTSLGATINLNAGGDYGWCIDKEETMQALLQAIEDETQGNLDPVYLYTANDRSANDIGNTYVEVCISQQKMWCYKDGVLVTETPVTTGNHATGYDTPAGSVWAVDAKKVTVISSSIRAMSCSGFRLTATSESTMRAGVPSTAGTSI